MAIIKSYTDLEQSKKLAEILPIESADLKWFFWGEEPDTSKTPSFGYNKTIAEAYKDTKAVYLPCWSLAALLGVLPRETRLLKSATDDTYHCDCHKGTVDEWFNNPVDACVVMVVKLHELKML